MPQIPLPPRLQFEGNWCNQDFFFISVGSGRRQRVTDGSDHQLSVSILKTSAIMEKWVGKTQEESQRRWRLSLVPCDQIRAAQAAALPESTGEGGVYLGVWRGGAWSRIRGIPDERMFLWMSAATFYTSPRNGTTDGHKIYTPNILMFYSPVWETFMWGMR